jgi:hypothetical protein
LKPQHGATPRSIDPALGNEFMDLHRGPRAEDYCPCVNRFCCFSCW